MNRKSNIELLRMFAMFLVLVLHSAFFTFGIPSKEQIQMNFVASFGSFFIESIGIVSVNVFVLISGWFRIKPKVKGISAFFFQCVFFYILIYIVSLLLGISSFSTYDVSQIFLLTDWNWFILAYIGLYLLAPILNVFLDNTSEKDIRQFLILFFLFQTIYSWLSGAAKSFVAGYSTLSFVGLYILSAYTRMYLYKFIKMSSLKLISIFLVLMFIHAVIAVLIVHIGYIKFIPKWYSYINPISIFGSLLLFLCFSKMNFSSNFINKISISSFGVFLLHFNPWLTQSYYCEFIKLLSNISNGILFICFVCLFLIFVFFLGVFIDKVRIYIWAKIV